MRQDMNRVIIEVGRVGGYGEDKGKKKSYQREESEDFEGHVTREATKRWYRYGPKSQSDRLSPLRHFLKRNVGRQWSEVYSEICAVNDKRSLVGFHLLTHLDQEVIYHGSRSSHYGFQRFFEDTDGTLQEQKISWRNHWKRDRTPVPVKEIQWDDGTTTIFEKGIWYRTWIEEYFVPYSEEYLAEENGEVTIKRTPQRLRRHERHYKLQCGKKELKQIREWLRQKFA